MQCSGSFSDTQGFFWFSSCHAKMRLKQMKKQCRLYSTTKASTQAPAQWKDWIGFTSNCYFSVQNHSVGICTVFCEVCAELGGTVQPGPVFTSMSHASATVLALLLQTGKYYCLSPAQHLIVALRVQEVRWCCFWERMWLWGTFLHRGWSHVMSSASWRFAAQQWLQTWQYKRRSTNFVWNTLQGSTVKP